MIKQVQVVEATYYGKPFSGTFPYESRRTVAYCQSRQAYSSGGCAGITTQSSAPASRFNQLWIGINS